jgi:hypothetical protein
LTTNGENSVRRSGFRIENSREIKIYNCCQMTVRSLILEIKEGIKSCMVRDVVDKETQAISSVKESVVEDHKEA